MDDTEISTKSRKKQVEYFTQSEIDSLIDYLDKFTVPTLCKAFLRDRDKLLILFLWGTGLRISDALGIRLENIDFEKESLTFKIRRRSQKVDHTISLDKALLYEIVKYRDNWRITNRLFDMSRDNFDKRIKGYCDVVGIKPRSSQKLRKGMALKLFGKVPIEVISYRLGRSSTRMVDESRVKVSPEIEKRFLKDIK